MECQKEEEIEIDLLQGIVALWRRKWLIAAVIVFTTCCGWLFTLLYPSVNNYEATASIYTLAKSYDSDVTVSAITSEMNLATQTLTNYATVLTSNKFLEKVVVAMEGEYSLSAAQLQRMVSSTSASDTVMYISVSSSDPDLSIALANKVTEEFVKQMNTITQNDSIQILDSANSVGVTRNNRRIVMMFFAIGFLGTVGTILIVELFFPQLRAVSQCVREDSSEILGIVPDFK